MKVCVNMWELGKLYDRNSNASFLDVCRGGSNGKSMFVTAINTALGEYHNIRYEHHNSKRPPNEGYTELLN